MKSLKILKFQFCFTEPHQSQQRCNLNITDISKNIIQSLEEKHISIFSKCPICCKKIKQPKILQCYHSFCLNPCLENIVETLKLPGILETKLVVKCPICGKNTVFNNNLSNIPDNTHLKNLKSTI